MLALLNSLYLIAKNKKPITVYMCHGQRECDTDYKLHAQGVGERLFIHLKQVVIP